MFWVPVLNREIGILSPFMINYVVGYLPILNERTVFSPSYDKLFWVPVLNERSAFSPFMVNYVVGYLYSMRGRYSLHFMINYVDGYLDLMSGRYYLPFLVHST